MVCLGAALVVFFAGVTASVAAGQTPPTAAASTQASVAPGAAQPAADKVKAEGAKAVAKQATADASAHLAAAAETPETKWTTVGLAVLFFLLLILSVVLASGLIAPSAEFVPSLKSLHDGLGRTRLSLGQRPDWHPRAEPGQSEIGSKPSEGERAAGCSVVATVVPSGERLDSGNDSLGVAPEVARLS
jgi:hypothetical protein